MRKISIHLIAATFLLQVVFQCPSAQAQAPGQKALYPAMAPLDQYLIADKNAEIALARSAAPASVADAAEVMVLGRDGYTTAVKGTNGFLCIVERSWANATDSPQFWNPHVRAPNCFNAAATRTFVQIYLMKTKLVLAGKSKAEILDASLSALDKKEIHALEPGAMCYMMSKQQYLNDQATNWHPHLMFFVAGDAVKSWGANLPDTPLIGVNDPQERVTVMMMLADKWSDGTAGPAM